MNSTVSLVLVLKDLSLHFSNYATHRSVRTHFCDPKQPTFSGRWALNAHYNDIVDTNGEFLQSTRILIHRNTHVRSLQHLHLIGKYLFSITH